MLVQNFRPSRHIMSAVVGTSDARYIGSHVGKALAQAGYLPMTLDNLGGGRRWTVKWEPSEEGDLAVSPACPALCTNSSPASLARP